MSDPLIGQYLGQYEIRMVLGKGGMSTVYLAYQPSMDRTVAIKALPREFLHDDTFLVRFQQEARTIAQLEHMNILPVYDVGEDQGIPYIVMRYLKGGTLADLIDSGLPQMSVVTRAVSQIGEALDYAHNHGIIHRDLKPSNILLDTSGNAFLADFGIARVMQQTLNVTGEMVIGTPPYIAPEMVRKDGETTPSVDLYALAAITFEMLSGEPPYWDDDPMKILMAHVLEPIPSVRDFDPNLSPTLDEVLRRGLAKNAEERFPTGRRFAHELERAAQATSPSPIALEKVLPKSTLDEARAASQQPAAPANRQGAAASPTGPPARTPPQPAQQYYPQPGQSAAYPPAGQPGYDSSYPRQAPRRRGRVLGCALAIGGVGGVLGLFVVLVFLLTDGEPSSLLSILTPLPTRALTPSGNPTATLGPDSGALLPPPSGGDRLAFVSDRTGNFDLYLIDIDGSNLRQLTSNERDDLSPSWAPDGDRIVYSAQTSATTRDIALLRVDGQVIDQLTSDAGQNIDPDWSPDGQWIAFASDRDGSDYEIYLMRSDGSELTQLTNNSLDDFKPRWSPDSQRISYHTEESDGQSNVYILERAGGAPLQLTNNSDQDRWPEWSPQGFTLVYVSSHQLLLGDNALFLVDVNQGEGARAQLLQTVGSDEDPAWSGSGSEIAFASDRNGSGFDLYVFDILTGVLQQLTQDDGDDRSPAWQPQP
ncbi:MAG: protein kinase [Chloroflexi bacterium]|nr:protein kinase [Chloroflexota bacterium]